MNQSTNGPPVTRRGLLHFLQSLVAAALGPARLAVGLDVLAGDSGLPHLPQNLDLPAFTLPQDRHAIDISAPPFLE